MNRVVHKTHIYAYMYEHMHVLDGLCSSQEDRVPTPLESKSIVAHLDQRSTLLNVNHTTKNANRPNITYFGGL